VWASGVPGSQGANPPMLKSFGFRDSDSGASSICHGQRQFRVGGLQTRARRRSCRLPSQFRVRVLIFGFCFRAKQAHLKEFEGLLPQIQGHNLALTVLYVPYRSEANARSGSNEGSYSRPIDFGMTQL
jgi:hypothetical protein